jgi:predicted small lipoprotein YifL
MVLALLSACGQKGALYLPPRNGTVVTRPAGATAPPETPSNPAPAPQDQSKKDADTTKPK